MENNRLDEQWNRDDGPEQGDGKKRFWTGVLAGALVTAFAGLIVVGMSAGIYIAGKRVISQQPGVDIENQGPSISGDSNQDTGINYDYLFGKMELIEELIDSYFLYDPDSGQVEDYILRGMLAGLDDPYSVYYPEADYKELMDSTSGVYSGIGAMISQNRMTGLCTIVKVFEGSPAQEAGMRPGDILYKVGDLLVGSESLDVLVSNYIKGKEGTTVNITVYRAEQDEYVDLVIERRKMEVPTVEYSMLSGKIGYVAVSEFDEVTADQFKEAIDQLTEDQMEGLIIDLRNNPGGLLEGAAEMVDYLLADDIDTYEKGKGKTLIVYTGDKNDEGEVYVASDGHEVEVPIAILMNGDSASASEVFAGAMRDYDKAEIVGTVSYGKGIVQSLIPLGDGTAIKITVSRYYTPSGFDLHQKGIEPDVEVELDEALKTQVEVEPEEDNQVQKAMEVLKEK